MEDHEQLVAAVVLGLVYIAHSLDVVSTVRNLAMGMREDNPWMRALIEFSGQRWRFIKLGVGMALSTVIYVVDQGAFGVAMNAFWVGFLLSTAMRNWMAGDRHLKGK